MKTVSVDVLELVEVDDVVEVDVEVVVVVVLGLSLVRKTFWEAQSAKESLEGILSKMQRSFSSIRFAVFARYLLGLTS